MTDAEIEAKAQELYTAFRETHEAETLPWAQITLRAQLRYREKAVKALQEEA